MPKTKTSLALALKKLQQFFEIFYKAFKDEQGLIFEIDKATFLDKMQGKFLDSAQNKITHFICLKAIIDVLIDLKVALTVEQIVRFEKTFLDVKVERQSVKNGVTKAEMICNKTNIKNMITYLDGKLNPLNIEKIFNDLALDEQKKKLIREKYKELCAVNNSVSLRVRLGVSIRLIMPKKSLTCVKIAERCDISQYILSQHVRKMRLKNNEIEGVAHLSGAMQPYLPSRLNSPELKKSSTIIDEDLSKTANILINLKKRK